MALFCNLNQTTLVYIMYFQICYEYSFMLGICISIYLLVFYLIYNMLEVLREH